MKKIKYLELPKDKNLLYEFEHQLIGYRFNIHRVYENQITLECVRKNKNKNIYITFFLSDYKELLVKNGYEISDFIHKNYDKIKCIVYNKARCN